MDLAMLRVQNLCLRAGEFALQDVCLQVRSGEYFVLMGPTGSGKSLLVKAICGLMPIAAGRVLINGRDVTALEPRQRRVGYVPQDSALFPHLTVERNITFALETAGLGRRQARQKVAPVVETLGIENLLGRSPLTLSGGETQKVALARALARSPDLLLLDEPVSALDEPTRREICPVLKRVQREFDLATLHVCHSREEAQDLADRVGILSAGRLVQTGTMEELTARPADELVRRLLLPTGRAPASNP